MPSNASGTPLSMPRDKDKVSKLRLAAESLVCSVMLHHRHFPDSNESAGSPHPSQMFATLSNSAPDQVRTGISGLVKKGANVLAPIRSSMTETPHCCARAWHTSLILGVVLGPRMMYRRASGLARPSKIPLRSSTASGVTTMRLSASYCQSVRFLK